MKRYPVLFVCLAALALVAGGTAFAQDAKLAVSANAPTVDGVVKADEYSFTKDFGKVQLFLSRSADNLWIGVVGSTEGWVAVGLDSLRMDRAAMFMGSVDPAGKVQFKPQVGVGRSHKDTAEKTDSIVASAMKEAGGRTTLEFALKEGSWLTKGQSGLNLIWAYGGRDSFSSLHRGRGSLAVALAQ